jgi:hypothetical protein
MEGDAVQRLAVRAFDLFDFDTVRVVGADFVQGEDVGDHQPSSTSGTAMTCSEKKRFNVASDTTKSPRIHTDRSGPMTGIALNRK